MSTYRTYNRVVDSLKKWHWNIRRLCRKRNVCVSTSWKRFLSLLAALGMVILLALPGWAAPWTFTSGTERVEKGKTLSGDLYFGGDTLEVEGEVRGDLIVFARQVVIHGRVDGSVLGVATEKMVVNGSVGGALRVAATQLVIGGKIDRTAVALAVGLMTGKSSLVKEGIWGTCGEARLNGAVGGPVELTVRSKARIGGSLGENLTINGGPMTWAPPVNVKGRVDDYSGMSAAPRPGQKIAIQKGYHLHQPPSDDDRYYKYSLLFSFIWFIGSLLMSLIFYRIFPRTAWKITQPTRQNLKRSFIVGMLTFFLIPALIIILLITTVGLPLAIILGLLYLCLWIFAAVPFNILMGRMVLLQFGEKYAYHPHLLILTGGLIGGIISMIPLFGILLPTWLGFGMIVGNIRPQIGLESRSSIQN